MDKRRSPRVHMSLHLSTSPKMTTEQFKLSESGKVFSVYDLSHVGMALRILNPDDLHRFPVARVVKGTLNFKREKYPIEVKVRNVRPDTVGCEFHNLEPHVFEIIQKFLDPSRLGHDLKKVEGIDHEALMSRTQWYHSPSGTDVLVSYDKFQAIDQFQIFVLGSFIQWEQAVGLTTGRIAAAANERGKVPALTRLETMLLEYDSMPDLGRMELANTLISNAEIETSAKEFILKKIKG